MSTSRPPTPTATFVSENLHAPEVFASGATSFSISDGVVTINFVSARWDNSTAPPVQRFVVVQRVVLPLRGARNLAMELTHFLEGQGIAVAPQVEKGTVQ